VFPVQSLFQCGPPQYLHGLGGCDLRAVPSCVRWCCVGCGVGVWENFLFVGFGCGCGWVHPVCIPGFQRYGVGLRMSLVFAVVYVFGIHCALILLLYRLAVFQIVRRLHGALVVVFVSRTLLTTA